MEPKLGKEIMYTAREASRTLDDDFLTDALRTARNKELLLLQDELLSLHAHLKERLRILDIGIGDGYVPLNCRKDVWAKIETYVGIDNSDRELERCEKNIRESGLENKVSTLKVDAAMLGDASLNPKWPIPFHAVLCTYFTPGNFKPEEIDLGVGGNGLILPYPDHVLSPNKKFQKIFSAAYTMLCDGGKLILGSVYRETPETRLKQEAFYKKCGMHIMTTEKDTFTATQEGFWSQRFTDEKIYSYLNWIGRQNIQMIPLDTENFAQMVVITKHP